MQSQTCKARLTKKKSELKMDEKEASVTESNNEEYVHSTSYRKLNNPQRENFRSNSMKGFVKMKPWLLLIDLLDMLKIWGIFLHK